jgi:hypothetical protein
MQAFTMIFNADRFNTKVQNFFHPTGYISQKSGLKDKNYNETTK